MKKSLIQKLAFLYSALFFGVVLLNYIPAIHDEQGNMFGLFHLDLIDDLLHLGSAVWALIAGWYSIKATTFYFRWFGSVYLLDGVIGIFICKGLLDFGIFSSNPAIPELATRIAVNVPHILIGGSMAIIGFFLSKYVNGKSNSMANRSPSI